MHKTLPPCGPQKGKQDNRQVWSGVWKAHRCLIRVGYRGRLEERKFLPDPPFLRPARQHLSDTQHAEPDPLRHACARGLS
eukprot:3637406-Rhodomonas_salina.3